MQIILYLLIFTASQVRVDMETNSQPVVNERLDELFDGLYPDAVELVNQDLLTRGE